MKDVILDGPSMRGLWSPLLVRLEVETLYRGLVSQHATKRIKSSSSIRSTETWRRPLIR